MIMLTINYNTSIHINSVNIIIMENQLHIIKLMRIT